MTMAKYDDRGIAWEGPPINSLSYRNRTKNTLNTTKHYLKRPKPPLEVFDPTIITLSYLNRTQNALKYHVIMDPPVRN